jgi:DNA-binding NarL/FixJ family response regulator
MLKASYLPSNEAMNSPSHIQIVHLALPLRTLPVFDFSVFFRQKLGMLIGMNATGSKAASPSNPAKKRVPEVPELSRAALSQKVKIAVVESDPLRFIGFRALFDSEPDMELFSASASDIASNPDADLILLGSRGNQNLFDVMAGLKAQRPDLRILVTGAGADDEMILKALAAGAKGYVDEAASPNEFAMAIRIVNQGSVWAPRRVLSTFIERVTSSPGRIFPAGRVTFTDREKEVLELLVAGRSNKEIGAALGIEERTVKAHVAKLMRKVGVQNRIALSVHAITHSLVANR